jgi:tetratricopeptide (TPR) repeat protein
MQINNSIFVLISLNYLLKTYNTVLTRIFSNMYNPTIWRLHVSFPKYLLILLILCVSVSNVSAQKRKLDRANQAVKKGIELYRQKEFAKSADVFERILAKDKNSLISKEMLGLIAFQTHNVDAAARYAKLSLNQDAKSAPAHFVSAWVLAQKGKLVAARAHLRKAKKYADKQYEQEMIDSFIKKHNLDLTEYKEKPRETPELPIQQDANLPYLAVFDFDSEEANKIGSTVSEMLITALIESNRFNVIERAQLDKILQEQALGMSGALDDETAVDVGELLGLDAVVVGSISQLGRSWEVDARIIDARSGQAVSAASASAPGESELRSSVNQIAKKFAGDVHKIEQKINQTAAPDSLE